MTRSREIYAVRYGESSTRRSAVYRGFAQSGHADAQLEMDFTFWVVRDAERVTLVDCGFDPVVGAAHGRRGVVDVVAALDALGIRPDDVRHIVVTHAHYDHIGNLRRFPGAAISVQGAELEFWSGPAARQSDQLHLADPLELAALEAAVADGRASVLDGDRELDTGLRVELVGGHTGGQQIVVVTVGEAEVVLTSDAVHFYEELDLELPYDIADDPQAMVRAYRRIRAMQAGGAVIVAGHDPEVRRRFAPIDGVPRDLAVRIA